MNPKKKADILIISGIVMPMNEPEEVILNGAIAVGNGRILAVGEAASICRDYSAEKVLDAAGKAVLPGLIDTHHHLVQHYLKASRDDVSLPEWIEHVSSPVITKVVRDYKNGSAELQMGATRLGCLEALKMGITTILNMEWATHPDIIGLYDSIGNRVVHTLTFTDVDEWNNPDMLLPLDQAFELAGECIRSCQKTKLGRIRFRYGLADELSCSLDLMKEVRRRANADGTGIHLHMAETERTVEKILKRHNLTPTGYLYRHDILGPDVLGAHCIFLNDDDIQIFRETGTTVSHNPEANCKVSEGIAPVAALDHAGVTVGLGIDTVAANDNMDMFEAMRTAAFLQKVQTRDPRVLPASKTLFMATMGGAKALQMDDETGSLEVGKAADIILIDTEGLHMQPRNNLFSSLVYCASAAADVKTVIVGGEILVEDGVFTSFDEREEIERFKSLARRKLKESGITLPEYY
jgi:5-methylthioadenosine/S-adenosylhomocysteine deaminase